MRRSARSVSGAPSIAASSSCASARASGVGAVPARPAAAGHGRRRRRVVPAITTRPGPWRFAASRNGDPQTPARQFRSGYFGLQTYGGTDRIFYRDIRVRDLEQRDIPRNLRSPEVVGKGRVGKQLTCLTGKWDTGHKARRDIAWYRSNKIGPDHPHYRAPSQNDLGSFTEPADPRFGTQDLPYLGAQNVGSGKHHRTTAADAGKLVYCQVSVTDDGATAWKTASAPEIVAGK